MICVKRQNGYDVCRTNGDAVASGFVETSGPPVRWAFVFSLGSIYSEVLDYRTSLEGTML